MARTTCLVVEVSYVCGRSKKALAKQVIVASTKQSRQAVNADKLTRLPGRQGSQACLLCFVFATSALVFLK
jgi:hypothetical protein